MVSTAPKRTSIRTTSPLTGLEGVLQDLRYALRRLLHERNFSLPLVVTLAIGIGTATAVFALVYAVLIRPLPYREANRLVAIMHSASKVELPMNGVSPAIAAYYRANNRVFEEIGMYAGEFFTLTDLTEAEWVRGALITPSMLAVLRPTFSVGRTTPSGELPPSSFGGRIISHSLWQRRYDGDPSILTRTIEIDRRKAEADGVLAPGFAFPHPNTHVWDAWNWSEEPAERASLRSLTVGAIARLKPGVSHAEAEQDLQRLVRTFPDAFTDVTQAQLDEMGFRARVRPLKEAVIGDTRIALVLVMATAGMVLLITWANAANLTLVRAGRIRHGVAVAQALGASQRDILRRFLTESLILSAAGGAMGLAAAAIAIEMRFGFSMDAIPRLREVTADAGVLGLTLLLATVSCGIIAAIAAFGTFRRDIVGALGGVSGRVTAGRREHQFRRIVVVGQIALALTLLIGSGLLARSFWQLKQVRLGFEPRRALTFHLPIPPLAVATNDPADVSYFYHRIARVDDEVLARIRALPGVEAAEAASVSGFPLTPVASSYSQRVAVVDGVVESVERWPYALRTFATPGYFRAMGIPVLQGRTFHYEDTGSEGHGVILSESLARALFKDEYPIGRRLRSPPGWTSRDYVVVGVVGDVPSETIRDGPTRVLYFPNLYPPMADTVTGVVHFHIPNDEIFVVRSQLPMRSMLRAFQRIVREVDPKLVVTNAAPLTQLVADDMARTRLAMFLLIVASVTSLVLAVIGIYGVLSYTVTQRVHEFGVRIALGQRPQSVAWMVVQQGTALALAGMAGGLFAAYAFTHYLRSLLFEVSPSDPTVFIAMAVLLLGVAVAASYMPARRASRIAPLDALRTE